MSGIRTKDGIPVATDFTANTAGAVDFIVDTTSGLAYVLKANGTVYQVGSGGGASWGGIGGTLSSQTDLQAALDAKGTSNFSGAYADLTSKPTLGSAAATASTDYATAAQGTTANSALQPAGNGGSLTGLTKTQVGLANVDNTSDVGKPVSTAQQAALDLKANLASPTFTGTVGGITAAMVGLGSVNNTSDASKPISTATQSALDAKQAAGTYATGTGTASGTNTGDQTISDATISTTDITTNNVSITKHGFAPKAPNNTTTFLRGDATWAAPPGGASINTLRTTSDQTINGGAATFVDITGLTFAVVNGTDYAFEFYITFRSAATTTGWKAGVNCPAGKLDFWAGSDIIANGAAGVATHTERHNVVRDDMTLLTATITQAVDLNVRIKGRYLCTENGTFAARFANELAANTNVVVQKGSWGTWF